MIIVPGRWVQFVSAWGPLVAVSANTVWSIVMHGQIGYVSIMSDVAALSY